ncbi:MAG: 50S ribosomal protein L24 [Clostridia bacterium]|nr:50S ribosomal protein L24 [Clostridia bacterium]
MEIKKGDNVVVLTGKDKGKKGVVIEAHPADNRVVVEGVNLVVKHMKPRGANQPGGKVNRPAAIDVSNVMIVCPECGNATKIAHERVDNKNLRKCKKCGALLDVKAAKKAAKKSTKKAAVAEAPAAEAPKKKTAVKKATKKAAE